MKSVITGTLPPIPSLSIQIAKISSDPYAVNMPGLTEIEAEAMRLSPHERAILAARLVESLLTHLPAPQDALPGDGILSNSENFHIAPIERAEDERRYKELEANPSAGMTLEEFRQAFGR